MTIEELTSQFMAAKQAEDQAKAKRIAAEAELVNAIGGDEAKSSTTQVGAVKVVITKGYSFKADTDAMRRQLGDNAILPIRLKEELDVKLYNALEKSDPDFYLQLSEFVTRTPKKPSVSVKL